MCVCVCFLGAQGEVLEMEQCKHAVVHIVCVHVWYMSTVWPLGAEKQKNRRIRKKYAVGSPKQCVNINIMKI